MSYRMKQAKEFETHVPFQGDLDYANEFNHAHFLPFKLSIITLQKYIMSQYPQTIIFAL
jgi:hypothetical protein